MVPAVFFLCLSRPAMAAGSEKYSQSISISIIDDKAPLSVYSINRACPLCLKPSVYPSAPLCLLSPPIERLPCCCHVYGLTRFRRCMPFLILHVQADRSRHNLTAIPQRGRFQWCTAGGLSR